MSLRPWTAAAVALALVGSLFALVAPASSATPVRFTSVGTTKVVHAGSLYFFASDGVHGTELWVTNGTVAGTKMVVDSNPGGSGSNTEYSEIVSTPGGLFLVGAAVAKVNLGSPSSLTVVAPKISFGYDELGTVGTNLVVRGGSNNALWGIDVKSGAMADLGRLAVGATGARVGSYLYFHQGGVGMPSSLSRTDGTAPGTSTVKEIPGYQLDQFVATTNRVYFGATKSSTSDHQTWVSDGSAAGTVKLTSRRPYEMVAVGNRAYFTQRVSSSAWELWTSTGGRPARLATATGSNAGIWDLTPVGGRLAYVRNYQLWTTDATAKGSLHVHPGALAQQIHAAVPSLGQVIYSGNIFPKIGYTWQSGRYIGSTKTLGIHPAMTGPRWVIGTTLFSVAIKSDGFQYPTFTRIAVKTPVIAMVKRARIVGKAKAGKVLTLKTGSWTPSSVSLSYRWYVGKKLIKGAKGKKFKLTKKHRGKKVFVVITASAPGAKNVRYKVPAVRVRK